MKRRFRWYQRLGAGVGGIVAASTLRLLGSTWRVEIEGDDPLASGEPFLGAQWHRSLFCSAYLYRDLGAVIPVSLSRDGEYVLRILARLGYGPSPRGSSSRGGRALLSGMIRAAKSGRTVGVLCDGPRGPAGEAKPGVLALARATGRKIRPLGVAADPVIEFPTWDRMMLPRPFARVRVVYGPPIAVPRRADRETIEELRRELERELTSLEKRAHALLSASEVAAEAGPVASSTPPPRL